MDREFTELLLEQIVNRSSQLIFFRSSLILLGLTSSMHALPEGETVTHGSAQFSRNSKELIVNQGSDRAIVNYSRFNIAGDETVRFNQPSHSSAILNRVTGSGASTIAGTIQANGNVYLINRSGILFSPSSRINVHGLVASAMELSNTDFLNGNLEFTGPGGSVINRGTITSDHAYLIGRTVQNSGSISAAKIALAAGEGSIKIDEAAGGDITLIIDGDRFEATEEPRTADIDPGSEEGQPEGSSGDELNTVLDTGDVYNEGSLDADGESGGHVAISGNRVANAGNISANGHENHAGEISVRSRESLLLNEQSHVSANAGISGDGGRIIFYSSGDARFENQAFVSARGGSDAGSGGFVEFSGARNIELDAVADVSSTSGQAGQVYIDPADIDIVDQLTRTPANQAGANPVVFSPGNTVSEITANTIVNQLNFGDVEVNTASSTFNGPLMGTITVRTPINFQNAVDRTLRLVADESIDILQGSDIQPATSSTGRLNLDLHANNRIGMFNQLTDLAGGTLNVTADADGNNAGNVIIGSPASVINAGNVIVSGHNFDSVNLDINANDVRIDQTGNINHNGNIIAANELALLADGDLTILGRAGETYTLCGENGVVLSADNDQSMTDGALGTQNALVNVTTSGGPIFISGHQVDLQDFTLQTPVGNEGLIAIFGSDTVDLSLNDTTPNAMARHRAARFVAEAVNELRLGTPIVATGDALFESTNDQITHDTPNLATVPQVMAENIGFKARDNIGSSGIAGIDVDVTGTLLALSTDGQTINVTERNDVFIDTGELDSGDLTPFVPSLAGDIATPDVDLSFQVETEDPTPPTNIPDEPMDVTMDPEPENMTPPEPLLPVSNIPEFGTLERQRIERAKSAVILETATARVTAVQFAEFYFLHEKMQISEYANELDLYFIDHLVFGVAEITADPRIPVEVKGQIVHGGPRPYQL